MQGIKPHTTLIGYERPKKSTPYYTLRLEGPRLIITLTTFVTRKAFAGFHRSCFLIAGYETPFVSNGITLFRVVTMFCRTYNIQQNILHIQFECEEYSIGSTISWNIFHIQYEYREYSTQYCQCRGTLLWF
jgi:hypothetical protein